METKIGFQWLVYRVRYKNSEKTRYFSFLWTKNEKNYYLNTWLHLFRWHLLNTNSKNLDSGFQTQAGLMARNCQLNHGLEVVYFKVFENIRKKCICQSQSQVCQVLLSSCVEYLNSFLLRIKKPGALAVIENHLRKFHYWCCSK